MSKVAGRPSRDRFGACSPATPLVLTPAAVCVAKVKADGGLKEFLFNWGYKRKLYHLEEGRSFKNVRFQTWKCCQKQL